MASLLAAEKMISFPRNRLQVEEFRFWIHGNSDCAKSCIQYGSMCVCMCIMLMLSLHNTRSLFAGSFTSSSMFKLTRRTHRT